VSGRISDLLKSVSSGWVTLSALVVFLMFSALVLPQQASKAERETGSAVSPDTSLFYSPAQLYRIAEQYGEGGRKAYVRARFTLDLVWPLVYTFFLATSISWVFRKAFPPDSLWQRANLAPLVAALFDYLENLSTSVVMLRYPAHTAGVDLLAPVTTLLKWIFVGASVVLLVFGTGVAVWRWVGRRETGLDSGEHGPSD
jgi:hypothetical protein